MNIEQLDNLLEVSKSAKVILVGLASERFDDYENKINLISSDVLSKLFRERYEYAGLKIYDTVDVGLLKRFRFIKYIDGKFKVKETVGLHGDPEDEREVKDLFTALKFCFYECNIGNSIVMKRLMKLANVLEDSRMQI